MVRVELGAMTKQQHLSIALVTDRGIMTKMVAPAYSTGDGQGRNMCTLSLSTIGPTGPAHGGEGQRSPGALSSIFLSLSCTLGPSLGL
jgi:hypothetical protein